jgi:Sporulation and spore germination/Kelch motif
VKTLLGVVALVVAAGAIGYVAAGWGSEKAVSLGSPPGQTASSQATQSTALPSGRGLEVWFSRGGRLVEALRTHSATRQVATAAVEALLAGPDRAERAAGIHSEIPSGTRLNSIAISNGVARIDLSSDYQAGASSRALQLRLAQVVYTLTQFPTVSSVRLSVDGEPVLGHPVGRGAYRTLAPVASPLAGSWKLLPGAPVPAQADRSAVWTGRELLVLGRRAFASYDPRRNTWRRLTSPPAGRYRPVWTGKELLAWGSRAYSYTPATRTWKRLPKPLIAGPPTMLAWTGHELVGWNLSGGAVYQPAANRWRRLPSAPFLGPAAWTGHALIAVSGVDAFAFSPAKGWRQLPPVPEPRHGANVVWDGTEVLVVGGDDAPTQGFAFDPKGKTWRRLASMDSGRAHAAAVWTEKRLLVWGGETGSPGNFVTPPHGLAYDPRGDRWSPLPQAPLQGRLEPAAAWTGRSLIVWGGAGFADGAAFTPR